MLVKKNSSTKSITHWAPKRTWLNWHDMIVFEWWRKTWLAIPSPLYPSSIHLTSSNLSIWAGLVSIFCPICLPEHKNRSFLGPMDPKKCINDLCSLIWWEIICWRFLTVNFQLIEIWQFVLPLVIFLITVEL